MNSHSIPSKISISNIAWPAKCDDEAVELSRKLGYEGIDLAPGKVFSKVEALEEARSYKRKLEDRGLTIPAFQSIIFGVENCALFGSLKEQDNLRRHLENVAKLAAAVGAKTCVFGAPSLRDPGELTQEAAFSEAVHFFTPIADAFEAEGTILAFEANASHYGCKFITHTEEAIALVNAVGRLGFRLHLDTGTVALNNEPLSVIATGAALAPHFHASEPDLLPLGSTNMDHKAIGKVLCDADFKGWRAVEMRSTENWQEAMRIAKEVMIQAYSR